MAANVWKNSLKNVESDNNKILYETLLDFFLQLNDTYFLHKPRINTRLGSDLHNPTANLTTFQKRALLLWNQIL